ncbi:hypothetical protein CLONEX_02462 [[Clostridium] nexile DSM 1787]|nr:hypothetical protein CLONEX_02462 [[Clostridium] nexile DSM 1787]
MNRKEAETGSDILRKLSSKIGRKKQKETAALISLKAADP